MSSVHPVIVKKMGVLMKQPLGLSICLALFPATLAGQTPPSSTAPNGNAAGVPRPAMVEGRPIETRPPEKKDNTPAFPEQTRAPYHATAPFKVTTLVDNMHAPWSLAFLPEREILVTERLPGTMRILNTAGALSEPLTGVSVVASPAAKDIGLLDVVIDPGFTSNHRIFFTFFDFVDGTDSNTSVARARLDEAKRALTDVAVIFRAQPTMPSKRLGGKTGGRIAIGRDGSLFVTLGDRSDSPPWDVAQRLDTDLGKIIHITPDGAPAPDNPFIGTPGVLPEIWAYGSRNAEGLAFDPRTGRLWETEHGPRGGDELNIIERGKNYGWPVIVHGIDYPGTAIGEGLTHKEGMEEPVYYWDPVIAPSGLAFYTGNLFPQWKDSVFVGGLGGRMLDRLTLVNDKVVAEEPLLIDLRARIRDVRVGPDGAVYVLTDSGTASMSPNTPPTSRLLKLTPK
jgi:glucose/arabinose dehydrogenase